MSERELDDEVGVVVIFQVDEDSGCIRLEMNPKSQTLEVTESFQNSTPVVQESLQKNPENMDKLQSASTTRKAETKEHCSSLKKEKPLDAVSSNEQLTVDQSQPIEPQPYICCGAATPSTEPIHDTQMAHLPSQNRSPDLKDVETKLSNVLEEGRCKVVQRESCNHRYFFPGTRTETLERIRRVAQNGTEALQNRLRVAVLRENELRMDAEMARAEIEAAKAEKALAEILLDDTKHHEAMLQKDLQNAITELHRSPSGDSKRSSQSNGVLRRELQAIREALDLEILKREQSEAQTRFLIRELQERQSTKTYVSQLEEEVTSLRKELNKIHSSIDESAVVLHPVQKMNERDQPETESNECKYRRERPDRWYSPSRGETDRPSRSRRLKVVPSTANRRHTKHRPHPSHHKRSRTSSGEDVETQHKAEDSLVFSAKAPLPNRKLEYIPPVPPTRVPTEALRKARQDYMKETKQMRNRWQEIINER